VWPGRILLCLSLAICGAISGGALAQTPVGKQAAETVVLNIEGMRGPDKGGVASYNYYFKGLWNEIGVGTTEFAFVVQEFDRSTGKIVAMLVPTSTKGMNPAALGINPRDPGLLIGKVDTETLELTLSYFQAAKQDNRTLEPIGAAATYEIVLAAEVSDGGLVMGWTSDGYINVTDRNIGLVTLEALKRAGGN
jgi:hypothetical protein